jgi:hypothetical protein
LLHGSAQRRRHAVVQVGWEVFFWQSKRQSTQIREYLRVTHGRMLHGGCIQRIVSADGAENPRGIVYAAPKD